MTNPKDVCEYRPISILPGLSKVLEKLLKEQIMSYFNLNQLLNPYQSAYRSFHSTETATLQVINDVRREMDKGRITALVLLDFSKAFNCLNHDYLTGKLKTKFKFDSNSCRLINSYLNNRHQEVHTDSSISTRLSMDKGVPQGSVLGPILFSAFINDLPRVISNSKYHMYADDLQVYTSASYVNRVSCIQTLNDDIASIVNWSSENQLIINEAKTQSIIISNKIREISDFPRITVNGMTIDYSISVKDLGLHIDRTLSWETQISSIRKKVFSLLRVLWTTTKFGSVELKRRLVCSYILPHIMYCCTSVFGMHKKQLRKIELMFNACVRYVHGLRKYDHITPYVKTILGCSISEYFHYRVCSFIFKIIKFKKPVYLTEKFIQLKSARKYNFAIIKNKTRVLNASLFVRGVQMWNMLPSEVKNASSLRDFQRKYNLLVIQK